MSKLNLKKIKIYIILILISITFGISLILSGYVIGIIKNYQNSLQSQIEQQKREDCRLLLKDVINRFDHAIQTKEVDPSSNKSVSNWATYNFNGLRNGTINSSGFIIELGTEEYISDSDSIYKSISSSNKKTISSDMIFQDDQELAKKAYDRIKQGIDSGKYDNVSWKQNNHTEWLEWAVYPTATAVGINDEPKTIYGIKNTRYRKYVFIIRTDRDEVFNEYKNEFSTLSFMINTICALLVFGFIFMVIVMFFIVYTEFHRYIKSCYKGCTNESRL